MTRINREKMLDTFDAYVSRFDLSNSSIAYKKAHSKQVAENSQYITEHLSCKEEQIDLAWTIGLLHDFGRFQQIKSYNTFNDGKSIDHAALGNYILFQEHEIDKFEVPKEWYWSIRKAIFNHNKLDISEDLFSSDKFQALVIRDADKVDILKGSVTSDFTFFNTCTIDEVQNSSITNKVYFYVKQRKLIPFDVMTTKADYFMRLYAMYFDITFPASLQLIKEQGDFEKALQFEFTNPDNQEKFNSIKKEIADFTNSKLNNLNNLNN